MKNDFEVNQSNVLFADIVHHTNYNSESWAPISRNRVPEIVFVASFPPRECGIATYSQDLIKALNNKFNDSFTISICALESNTEKHIYTDDVKYTLNTDSSSAFLKLAKSINENDDINLVLIQHEFGLFEKNELHFRTFLKTITKPIIIVFHTVLPFPDPSLKEKVCEISNACESIIVMTNSSSKILVEDYGVDVEKITVIPHGTHLVQHLDKITLKHKYGLSGRKILSTFGLLSSGKSIETTLNALPAIVKKNPDVLFLIIGKTHPTVVKQEGEKYRTMLEAKVVELGLQNNVKFINYFLQLTDLLEYLQLTDIYLFTSTDPHQAVSGTFSYATSCGCPIISTPIPHACEVLENETGIIVDFGNVENLSNAVNYLLNDDKIRHKIGSNGLHKMASTAWENAAIGHATLFEKFSNKKLTLHYTIPKINLGHFKKMTTDFGMIQFSKINQPDIDTGFTIDDNARAMVAMCQHFELTNDTTDLKYIRRFLNFIKFCQQPEGNFLNYVDEQKNFTDQNYETNLADANGRAIWALGYLLSLSDALPQKLISDAEIIMQNALSGAHKIYSTRAMAFIIKGLYYRNTKNIYLGDTALITELADRLVKMYKHEAGNEWLWFESYLTYANSILPEALLCAWLTTGKIIYKDIAKSSFDFLLSKIFTKHRIKVISNKNWLQKNEVIEKEVIGGEQPIDIAYTILALKKFHAVYKDKEYLRKIEIAFSWFLGNNHLNQIIYNPCTGGCYDGLEEKNVNLNQGAESTVSYLMARLAVSRQQSVVKFNVTPASFQQPAFS